MARKSIKHSKILKQLLLAGARSRRDLAKNLHVSKASMTLIINQLLKQKIVEEVAFLTEERPGRKTIALRIKPDLAYFCGTDLEGSAIRAIIMDCEKKIIKKIKRKVEPEWTEDEIRDRWFSIIKNLINMSGIPQEKLVSIGIGLPGVVSREYISSYACLPNGRWNNIEAGRTLGNLLPRITAANNVICLSEYEHQMGDAKGIQDFTSILVRYGIGAASYSKGSPVVGEDFFTGELGHSKMILNDETCICGQKGCLDIVASGRTFDENGFYSENARNSELEKRAHFLGIGIANLLKMFHTSKVIINGIYNKYDDIISPVIKSTIKDELSNLKLPVPDIIFPKKASMRPCRPAR